MRDTIFAHFYGITLKMASVYSIDELKNKSPEWLLAARGRGPEHNADTHAMIEAEMIRRGLNVPAIPTHPVRCVAKTTWGHRIVVLLGLALFAIAAAVTPKFGVFASIVVLSIAVVVAFVVNQISGKRLPSPLSTEERAALDKGSGDGVTELMIVAASGNVERTVDLLNYGASVRDVTKSGLTPLMYAAGSGQIATYVELLKHGANADERSKRGLTAIAIAEEKGLLTFLDAVTSIERSCPND